MKKTICLFLLIVFNLTCLPAGRHLFIGSALASAYILAPGDTLEVKVIGRGGFEIKQAIAPDGSISLPFLGRVIPKGQTLEEFESFIAASMATSSPSTSAKGRIGGRITGIRC